MVLMIQMPGFSEGLIMPHGPRSEAALVRIFL